MTTMHILEEVDDLLILSAVEGKDFTNISGLPSWVPDWSVRSLAGLGVTGYVLFSAAENLPRHIDILRNENILCIKAAKLDTIIQVGETKEEVNTGKLFPGWLNILVELDPMYCTGQTR